MFGLTSFSLQSALVGKTTQGWNSLLCVDLAMLKRWLSLYVAILPKFFQLNAINLPFYVTSMTLIIFVNLSRLTLEKGGFTPVLTNHKKKKKKKIIKKSIFGWEPTTGKAAFQSYFKFYVGDSLQFFGFSARTFMLHYRIHSISLTELTVTELTVRKVFEGYIFSL